MNLNDRVKQKQENIKLHHLSADVRFSDCHYEDQQVILVLIQRKSWKQGSIFTSEISIMTFQ